MSLGDRWGAEDPTTGAVVAPPDDTTNNDFRRQEIVQMNADADGAKMAKWGLIGLGIVVVLGLMMQPSTRSKR